MMAVMMQVMVIELTAVTYFLHVAQVTFPPSQRLPAWRPSDRPSWRMCVRRENHALPVTSIAFLDMDSSVASLNPLIHHTGPPSTATMDMHCMHSTVVTFCIMDTHCMHSTVVTFCIIASTTIDIHCMDQTTLVSPLQSSHASPS
jgi:hypothetical protein